jgi:hypothetical protein
MAEESGFTVRDRRRVTLEGESAEKKEQEQPAAEAPRGGSESEEYRAERGQKLPPVDFSGFVLGLGQMALVHLGELPEPQSGNSARDLEQARHTIDLLDMLEEKTRGNLTGDEAKLLQSLVSELKLRYVRAMK